MDVEVAPGKKQSSEADTVSATALPTGQRAVNRTPQISGKFLCCPGLLTRTLLIFFLEGRAGSRGQRSTPECSEFWGQHIHR